MYLQSYLLFYPQFNINVITHIYKQEEEEWAMKCSSKSPILVCTYMLYMGNDTYRIGYYIQIGITNNPRRIHVLNIGVTHILLIP